MDPDSLGAPHFQQGAMAGGCGLFPFVGNPRRDPVVYRSCAARVPLGPGLEVLSLKR
jgi:hypothetical protein